MKATTRKEAVELALAEATIAARRKRGLGKYFKKADQIKRKRGWVPWWERRHGNSHAMKQWGKL